MTTTQIKAITETIAAYYNIPSEFKIVHAEIESNGFDDPDGYYVEEDVTVSISLEETHNKKVFCVTNFSDYRGNQKISIDAAGEAPNALAEMIEDYKKEYDAFSTVVEIYNELKDIIFFKTEEKIIKVDEIGKDDVIMLKQDYLDAQKIYLENISTSLLRDMLKDAPGKFKKFVEDKSIESVRYEDDVYSEDYMPDWAHLVIFTDDEQNDYAFVQNCSETYDEVQCFDGEIYFNESEIDNEVFEHVQQWYMKIFQAFDI